MNEFFLKPSQSTTIFGRVELSEALPPLAKAGYKIVELSRNSSKRAEHKPMLDDLGMAVWAVHGTLDLLAGMGDAPARRKALADELRAMADVAVYAPCPYIIHHLCRNTDPDGPDNWRQVVGPLHDQAKALGFVLSLETVPAKPAAAGGFPYVCKSAESAEFVRSFRSAHLGICIDMNHVNLYEDFAAVGANSAGLIRTVHVSDNHGTKEEHLVPGDGIINWENALAAIYKSGYRGPINMELHVPPAHETLVRARIWAEKLAEKLAPVFSEPSAAKGKSSA